MGSAALRRLMAEYKQLLHNPPDGVIAGPVNQVFPLSSFPKASMGVFAMGAYIFWLYVFMHVE